MYGHMKILITKGTTVLESRIEFGIRTPKASLTVFHQGIAVLGTSLSYSFLSLKDKPQRALKCSFSWRVVLTIEYLLS